MKVYCTLCLYFMEAQRLPTMEVYLHGDNDPLFFGPPEKQMDKCLAPQNFKDSYKEEASSAISQPSIINQFNDCVWFVPKEGPSSSSSNSSSSSSSSGL